METLHLPDYTTRRSIAISSIEYVEAIGNYSLVHLRNYKPLLVAITLKRLAERLPTFWRIHKSTLVNPACIVGYQLDRLHPPFVELSQNRRLTISRRQARWVKPHLDLMQERELVARA